MTRIYKYLIMLCYCLAFAWLLYWGLGGGVAGTVSAMILLIIVILLMMTLGGLEEKDVSNTLLFDFCCITSNIVLLYVPFFFPFTILFGLAGCFGILNWVANKKYKNKSIGKIFKEEFRFTPFQDVIFIVVLIKNGIEDDMMKSPFTWIILIFLLFDLLRQTSFCKLLKRSRPR